MASIQQDHPIVLGDRGDLPSAESQQATALTPANSKDLHLSQRTDHESLCIWKDTFAEWGDALTLPQYLEESIYVTKIPLAKDGGMTQWVLVDKNLSPNNRPTLASCEIIIKRALVSDIKGRVAEVIIPGIASVFCKPEWRHHLYGTRLMQELAKMLRGYQVGDKKCAGSILYSDTGKKFYPRIGWYPIPNNSHIEFSPSTSSNITKATPLLAEDLEKLCQEDEVMVRRSMETDSKGKTRMIIIPDVDHMRWHHGKEEFGGEKLFGKQPQIKGAMVGELGNRIWVIWTHRFYNHPDLESSQNKLYILRLVIENQKTSPRLEDPSYDAGKLELQAAQLKRVLEAAQNEAAEWKLRQVQLWDPSLLVQDLIDRAGMEHRIVDREHESISSLLWFGENGIEGDSVEWVANEYYAWL